MNVAAVKRGDRAQQALGMTEEKTRARLGGVGR
jgi:hypothetical protein